MQLVGEPAVMSCFAKYLWISRDSATTRGLQIFHKNSTRVRSRLAGRSLLGMASGTISRSHSKLNLPCLLMPCLVSLPRKKRIR